MTGNASKPHRGSWTVLAAVMLFTVFFVNHTAAELPARIAVHFDAAGVPNSYMTRDEYRHLILLLALGLPTLLVAILTIAYSVSPNLKIPNRDYWLAPQRANGTRAFLKAHGAWFGTLFAAMMNFTHWLVVTANRQQPPHLPNQPVYLGVLGFLIATVAWIAVMMTTLRRPTRV